MSEGDGLLPLGILLLGVAGIAGFMAFRPWPMPGGQPVKPGAYAVEILQGNPPAASQAPDRQADIAVIEGGLATLLGVWAASKLASALSGVVPALNPVAGGGATAAEGGAAAEGATVGEQVISDAEAVLGDVGGG